MKLQLLLAIFLGLLLIWAPGASAQDKPAAAAAATEAEGADEEDEAEDEDEEKGQPYIRSLAGSNIVFRNDVSANSFAKGADQTYNPIYSITLGLNPMWGVTEFFSIAASFAFNKELTDSDFSPEKYQTYISDLPINVRYVRPVERWSGEEFQFTLGGAGGIALPTSQFSRYATKQFQISLGGTVMATFPKLAKGITLGWAPRFMLPFYESATPKLDDYPLEDAPISGTGKNSQEYQALYWSGGLNTMWALNNRFFFGIFIIEDLQFSFSYTHMINYHFAPTDQGGANNCSELPQGCVGLEDTGADTRATYMSGFSYNLNYVLPGKANMLAVWVGAETTSNQLSSDGSYNAPFFNRHTMFNFGLTFNIHAMIDTIQGDSIE